MKRGVERMARRTRQWFVLGGCLAGLLFCGVYLALNSSNGQINPFRRSAFDGERAYGALKQICAFGPRPSNSPGMEAQRQFLAEHFQRLGARVGVQTWEERHPQNGSPVPMGNLIVEWHPDRQERILLCAHYDTRPFPDRDRKNPRGTFLGANDGASGVAVLYELGFHMPQLGGVCGVDFVLFDGEEFIFDDRRDSDRYFLGAKRFAETYAAQPPQHRYRWGVLLDMVGDAELQIYQERNSLHYARGLVNDIWRVAESLGVSEFKPRVRHEIRDDHLPLNEIARIPSCDIIDFDYPRPGLGPSYWHTEQDSPDKCSAASLGKVGTVVLTWLQQETAKQRPAR